MESNNYKNPESGCDIYGSQRLELAIVLREILNNININYCIENGTLLGAYRNKKFISHDDDFDFAVFIKNEKDADILYNQIYKILPKKYQTRLIDSYCNKIEVFDPNYGDYILMGPKYNGHNYHHVTIDLQFHLKTGCNYKQLYFVKNIKLYC